MTKKKINKFFLISVILIIISFLFNYFIASRGVFPVDTFIHFDSGFRIINGELPVRDYWIVHGFLVDYIQSIFFLVFGYNWSAYLIHSSTFNSLICFFSFYVFKKYLEINFIDSFIFSILIAFLAYPVSGTPFLDLHSSYFSLFAILFIIMGIIDKKKQYFFYSSILLTIAFFCKQVPAAYVIFTTSIFCFLYSFINKNYKFFLFYLFGGLLSLLIIFIFLLIQKINISDFIIQLFLFPKSFGENRYLEYKLNFKNVFLNFKFIYFFFLIIFILILINLKKKSFYKDKINIFIIFFIFSLSLMFHQIYTKNQIYIFFLIPFLGGFSIYYLNELTIKNKKKYKFLLISFCLIISLKYIIRFDLERKFHELNNTKIYNSYDFENFDKKFRGLKWISPYYPMPDEEIKNLRILKNFLEKEPEKTMLITEYQFYSLLLNKKLFSPSRTYDDISFPQKNSIYYKNYKDFLKKIIKKNEISSIIIFETIKINKQRLDHLVFNYISENCFKQVNMHRLIVKLEIKNCNEIFKIK